MDSNTFGKLVREFRKRKGWTQEQLAERLDFTREYISQIERGKRKLDKQEHLMRLADILDISHERLEAIGKGLPSRKTQVQHPIEGDDILLRALLDPALTTIKMSWLIWQGNTPGINVADTLQDWEKRLNEALGLYRGQFHTPALRLLAYTHEMLGKLAIERTATQEAMHHFQEMYDIGEEVADPNLLTLSLIHQSEMFRRRGWYQAMFGRMEEARKHVDRGDVSMYLQGVMWKAHTINSFVYGDEQGFLRASDHAEQIADTIEPTIDTLNSEFDAIEVLQTRAIGYTTLGQPEKALSIYKKIDRLHSFRPFRYQTSYDIIKAQTYCYLGDTTQGIKYAMTGLEAAVSLQSRRYVMRLKQMSDRINTTPLGNEKDLKELRGEILGTLRAMDQ